jgi:hypothetical protein
MQGLSIPRGARRYLTLTNIGAFSDHDDPYNSNNVVLATANRLVFEKWRSELDAAGIPYDIRGGV